MRLRIQIAGLIFLSLFFSDNAYSQPGTLDNTFGGTGFVKYLAPETTTIEAKSSIIQEDGRILVAGFNTISNDLIVVRYNCNGSLDDSMGEDGIAIVDFSSASFNRAFAVQPDGKILVGVNLWDGTRYVICLLRLNSDGSPDLSFNTEGRVTTTFTDDAFCYSLLVQKDGKIDLCGYFETPTGSSALLIRYNTDGTLDNNFNGSGIIVSGIKDVFYEVALQSTDKILVSGRRNSELILLRYEIDGSPDTTFDRDSAAIVNLSSSIYPDTYLNIQPDDRIILATTDGGNFAMARFLENGGLDSSFNDVGQVLTDFSANEYCRAIAISGSGDIILAGYQYTGIAHYICIAKFKNNGVLDSTFGAFGKVIYSGAHSERAHSAILQKDDKILVAGSSSVNLIILRYHNNGTITDQCDIGVDIVFFPNPTGGQITITRADPFNKATINTYDMRGKLILSIDNVYGVKLNMDLSGQKEGLYFIKITEGDKVSHQKVIKAN